jgi:serine/threonine-protein phosphatase with EF-hand domain
VSQVITIFSASNYYEVGSNKGAYVKLVGPQLAPHFVQFTTATPQTKKLTFRQRVGLVESSAIRELSGQILARREQLLDVFLKHDPEQTGETYILHFIYRKGFARIRVALAIWTK